jgi:hypothetical protein
MIKKDDIKKVTSKVHSAFDEFAIMLLVVLIMLVTYIGILRLVGLLPEGSKAFVIIGITSSLLVLMLLGISKGGKIRQGVIVLLIGFFGGMIFMRVLSQLAKMLY